MQEASTASGGLFRLCSAPQAQGRVGYTWELGEGGGSLCLGGDKGAFNLVHIAGVRQLMVETWDGIDRGLVAHRHSAALSGPSRVAPLPPLVHIVVRGSKLPVGVIKLLPIRGHMRMAVFFAAPPRLRRRGCRARVRVRK